ncbi:ankyrin repeat and protein kinase domain-containing protein 1 [Nothobranchius furzeri]|uniref:Ankyrin repeat and kinase domain containing 1 n=2 Tax=Nothobranchius TaxID=28779 RepID=A0A9D3BUU6_NOTFU|nr:ankyrin repeat and protein kinase domain-containing protein 1 [Nothobranchius furzeri]KAF7219383.1 ankyrin repeat and kinase domain containing 1 [Nothobranchius furzeri]
MDCRDESPGQFRDFRKDDFEADWIKLSEGKFGQVYQVKLKLGQEKCALKTFDTTLRANNFYSNISKEVSNAARLKFKNVISIYGLCSEATAVVVEFMSEGSLNNLLSSHTLMWTKKFQMIHEVSMGMDFLHSMKPPMLHLNLKTSNILLDDHLHVKISDFNIIQWEEGMSKAVFMERLLARGNISYIPPETFTQCPDPPGTTFDVYSFGVVMWEILTQQKPYAGDRVTTLILQVSKGKRPSLDIIPDQRPQGSDQMISIMKECWEKDPTKRPEFSDILKKTESLNETWMLTGSIHCQKNGTTGQKTKYPWLVSPAHEVTLPEASDTPSGDGQDGILFLLSKKDFSGFRQSVKKEHVCAQFSGQKSLLHFTVASGDLESVKHALSLGAEVNCTTARGYTPLIIAVLQRSHDIISLLLEHGATVTHGDEDGWTPLHFAVQNGDDRTVRLLLDKGAVADVLENDGWMPLHLASQNGHETVVRLLLSRLHEGTTVDQVEQHGRTPLHLASSYGHLNIVKLLLTHGADPNATDKSLSTALHLSADQGHNRIVRQLLKSGVNTDSPDSRRCTPLHLAALKGHAGICRQLLSNGANPESKTLQEWTPMHLAALRGHEAVVVQLESWGDTVNSKGQNGWTPLHLACYRGHPEVVAKLLSAKADPNIKEDKKGWTPLHVACNSLNFPCVLHLILHKADVNALNSGKATPLHLAAQHGCVSTVKALLMNGAQRSLQDSSGSTPQDVAQQCEKWEIVKLLEKDD